jgi:hypothetical protein
MKPVLGTSFKIPVKERGCEATLAFCPRADQTRMPTAVSPVLAHVGEEIP